MLIPLSNPVKTTSDVTVVGSAMLGFFKVIPWPEMAAFVAFLYTALRIVEMLWSWWRNR